MGTVRRQGRRRGYRSCIDHAECTTPDVVASAPSRRFQSRHYFRYSKRDGACAKRWLLLLNALAGLGGPQAYSRVAVFDHHLVKPCATHELLWHFAAFIEAERAASIARTRIDVDRVKREFARIAVMDIADVIEWDEEGIT